MPRLTPLRPSEVVRILTHLGSERIRQRGSHIYFRHPDGRSMVIPFHKGEDLGKGLLASILRDIEMSWDDFLSAR